jgi:iron complex transport system substrate-binding protein
MRVVSLLPSATEVVCALGAADDLVGISHECDFPEPIRDRAVLTRARVDVQGSSRQIDAAVRAVVRDALSIYRVDEATLAKLQPDVIVTQDLCEVCAVSLDDVRAAVARLAHRDQVRIVSLRPTRLSDVMYDVERIAAALERSADGRRVRADLEARTRAIATRAAWAAAAKRPRVVSIEWLDPIMLGGTWMPELIELAGGAAAGAAAGQLAPTVTSAELARLRPEVVVVKPCGFNVERTLAERALIESAIVAAVPGARLYVTDGNAFFNRPGPRLVESLEIMSACLHPEVFGDLAARHASVIVPMGEAQARGEPGCKARSS